jgi:Putative ABC exporter
MHPALWLLLRLDFQGSLRSMRSILRSWKRLGLLLMIVALVGMMVWARNVQNSELSANRFGQGMPFWALIYLSAAWLTASADRGLIMRPAEIHFLFGGPFRSRDIISLNLIRLLIRSAFSAAFLAMIGLVYLPSFVNGLLGLWLLLAVSLLVGMVVGLMARSANGQWTRRLRTLMTVIVVALILTQFAQSIQLIQARKLPVQLASIAATAPETAVGSILLPPLEWMFRPMSCTQFFPEGLKQFSLRLPIVAGLVGLIYLLGRDFSEVAAMRTDRAMAARQAALRSGSVAGTSAMSRRFSLPAPTQRRFGGIAAIAWWQSLNLLRILPRYLSFTVVVLGILIILPALVDRTAMTGKSGIAWLAGLSLYGDFLLLLQLPVGFMGPVSQREMLKTLPLPNWRIVLGQLVGPLLPVLCIHAVTTSVFVGLFPIPWPYLLCTSLALLPAALVIISNLNLLGIWGIIQPRALQQRDVLAAGRAMASVWLFSLMLIPAGIIAATMGLAFQLAFAALLPPLCDFILGCGFGCLLASLISIYLIATTFDNWQPTLLDRGEVEREHDG